MVPGEVLRHGRHAEKLESSEMSTGDHKAKPRSFTRIETLASSAPAHHTYHNQAPYTTALAYAPSHLTERATQRTHFTPQHWLLCHMGLY